MASTYPASEGLQHDDRPPPPPRPIVKGEDNSQVGKILAPTPIHNEKQAVIPPGQHDTKGLQVGEKQKRICGMGKKKFLILLGILAFLVIAGAVGGGVGGSLASKQSKNTSTGDSQSAQLSPTPTTSPSSSIPTTPTTLSTFTTWTTSSAQPTASVCPSSTTRCDDANCQGQNSPNGIGKCLSAVWNNCPCSSICGAVNGSCGNCSGRSNPLTGQGVCEAGSNLGCNCAMTCGVDDGPCSNCGGRNDPQSGRGTCEAGVNKGCFCSNVCGPGPGSCTTNDCNGRNGVCLSGPYWGCDCV